MSEKASLATRMIRTVNEQAYRRLFASVLVAEPFLVSADSGVLISAHRDGPIVGKAEDLVYVTVVPTLPVVHEYYRRWVERSH